MKLCSSIIFEELSYHYNLKRNKDKFIDKEIISPLIYDNQTIDTDYIYVITCENINNFVKYKNNTAVCIGIPHQLDKYKKLDLIIIENQASIYHIFNDLVLIFAKYNQWDSGINDIAYKHLNIQDIFTISDTIFLDPMYLIDKDLNYIAYNKAYSSDTNVFEENPNTIPLSIANNIKLETDFNLNSSDEDVLIYKSSSDDSIILFFNIKINNIYKARLVCIVNSEEYLSSKKFIFTFFAKFLEKIYIHYNYTAYKSNSNHQLHYLIEDFLFSNKSIDNFDLEFQLNKLGWKINNTYIVIFIKFIKNSEVNWFGSYFSHQLELRIENSCGICTSSGIVLVINQSKCKNSKENLQQELPYLLRESLCKAGISNPFNSFTSLPTYYRQAEIALSVGEMLNETIWCHHFKDYALHYMMLKSLGEFTPLQICHDGLLKLREYDTQKNTEYYKTLYALIFHKYNTSHAANALFIHRTTLISRLTKIFEISNIDLDDYDTRLYLMISFYILNVFDN